MNANTLERIETEISQLTVPDQLWLLERLAQGIRRHAIPSQPVALEVQLAAMAHDPSLQRELRLIEAEFAGTEADGLEVAD